MPLETREHKLMYQGEDGVFKELGIAKGLSITPTEDTANELDDLVKSYKQSQSAEFSGYLSDDVCVRKFVYSIIDKRLGTNNWRKLHGLPMWRLR